MYAALFCILVISLRVTLQANVHSHVHGHGGEREADGAFSPRDHFHYEGEEHNVEFDHEAILGSTKDAEEFDHLPAEEAKRRLAILLKKMDLNGNNVITPTELKQWILRSFKSLSEEESREKLTEVDLNKDDEVTWEEYLAETYGLDNDIGSDVFADKEHTEDRKLLKNDKELFNAADLNKDGKLNTKEFLAFTHPEEAPHMLETILKQTLEEKDLNKDGFIDFQEYIGERGLSKDKAWLIAEKDKFDHEFDSQSDGLLNSREILKWVLPSTEEIADEEVAHLFAASDDDHDGFLSFDEILEHHDVFVGSEATDYGDHLNNIHRFDDEL